MPDLTLETSPAFIRAGGMHFDHVSGDLVTGHIDAGPDHHTPWGIVHGGVYANHTEFIRSHREGRLDVRATPVHQGRTGQVWDCVVTRADGKLVARGTVRHQNVDLR